MLIKKLNILNFQGIADLNDFKIPGHTSQNCQGQKHKWQEMVSWISGKGDLYML